MYNFGKCHAENNLTPWGLTLLSGCHCCFVCNHWFDSWNIIYRSWNLASFYYCYHCHRHYHHNITEKYLLPWSCYLQVKFRYSEKATQIWNDLPLIVVKKNSSNSLSWFWTVPKLFSNHKMSYKNFPSSEKKFNNKSSILNIN